MIASIGYANKSKRKLQPQSNIEKMLKQLVVC